MYGQTGSRPMTARLDREAGVRTALMGLIPGGIGIVAGALLYAMRGKLDGPLPFILAGLGLWSLVAVLWGMWTVFDRSPRLILDEDGLTDHTLGRKRVIPWGVVARATLSLITRNGSEQGVVLTLHLKSPVMADDEITIVVSGLDLSLDTIFQTVSSRANLLKSPGFDTGGGGPVR